MIFDLHKSSIDYGHQRMRDFLRVTAGREEDEKYEAGQIFAGSLGLSEQNREHLANAMREYVPEDRTAWVLVGILMGLLIAEEESSHSEVIA